MKSYWVLDFHFYHCRLLFHEKNLHYGVNNVILTLALGEDNEALDRSATYHFSKFFSLNYIYLMHVHKI